MPPFFKSFIFLIFLALLGSCQQELHFEVSPFSEGVLVKDAAGNCDSIKVNGTLSANVFPADSNFIDVTVRVTKTGSYSIHSDTVNNYYYRRDGDFESTGTFVVRLPSKGTPLADGTDHFAITYGNSVCVISRTVLRDPLSPAVVKLAGEPGDCLSPVVVGDFVGGSGLDTSAGVELTVNVVETGSFEINTGIVNGYYFTASGMFTKTGIQKVKARVQGKPLTGGTDLFTVTLNGSVCSFPVKVYEPVVAASLDYFPLSIGSYWVYDYVTYSKDSLTRRVDGTTLLDTLTYKLVKETRPSGTEKDLYFRKANGGFLEFAPLDKYTEAFVYVSPTTGDIPILREGIATGSYWESPAWLYKATFGQLIELQYRYYCLNANGGAIVNGMAFGSVYKIRMYPLVGSEGNPGGLSGEIFDFWFAKGIGLIYQSKLAGNGQAIYEMKLRRWLVN
ncbi:MAG: hypothetical protein EOO05_05480 [Chitinophagaceae bacterium]|nr:MAG: hypothetical protein EOO05_05480 [Chitinophagaceae bacterium]